VVAALNSSNTVEIRQIAAIDTEFTARNYVLNFNLHTFGGNGDRHYRVSRVEAGAETASSGLVRGEVYTIKDPGNTDWRLLGAPEPPNGDHTGTTFVAAGPAAATDAGGNPVTGTAIPYTAVAGTVKLVSPVQGDTGDILYRGAADFNNIPDTIAGSAVKDKELFIVKVYDSTNTAAGSGENDQLAHAILLKLDVDNVDETKPVAGIKPFHWNSGADNSLYKNNAANGHIELEAGLPAEFTAGAADSVKDRDPKVSGKISIRGTAFDNAMLKTLWISLDGFDFGKPPAIINGRDYILGAVYTGYGSWEGIDQWETGGWKFTVDTANQVHDQSGHQVSWRLDIDTAKITNAADTNREFRTLARDGNTNDSVENNTQTEAGAETPYYRMDVVPYITEVETRLSAFNRSAPSVYARTARGAYPAADTDDITVYGFNLGGSPVISAQGAAGFTVQETGQGKDPRASWQYAKIKLGTAVKSGPLSLAVNKVTALNNVNNNNAEYNQQPNAVNNNTLTDDTALDVWQFTEVFKPQSEVRYPIMKVGPAGQIGFSFANDYQRFNMPGYIHNSAATNGNFWSQTVYQQNYGGYTHNTFAFDPTGNTYGAAISIDEATFDGNSANFSFINRWPHALPAAMGRDDNYKGILLNYMRLETTTMPLNNSGGNIVDINRIQSPVMITSMKNPGAAINNGDNRVNVYLAYYDRTTGQVRFRAGSVGANNSANTAGNAFSATVSKDDVIAYPNHGLRVGDQVYLYSESNSRIDKTRPYYVISANYSSSQFKVSKTPGGSAEDINATNGNVSVTVLMVGGGLADLGGYAPDRVNPVDARPDNYQTVAASGGYNPGAAIKHEVLPKVPNYTTSYTTTYPGASNYGPGAHVAIGVVKSGGSDVVVLAWFDEAYNRLVYSWNDDPFNTNPSKDSAGDWQTNARVIENYAGEGVSLATDSGGGIHLAYYSANGADLKYAHAPSYSGSFTAVTVDAYLSVGTHSTITVGKDSAGRLVPSISYYATGASALRAKLAYRDYDKVPGAAALAGADGQDKFTGAWEVTTVPAQNTPTEYRISVGVYTDSNGNITALPTGTNSASAAGDTRVYGNGTLNPVVGYATTKRLEMAQKK
jgi:hypothetical protein